jgi:hypothetical protein
MRLWRILLAAQRLLTWVVLALSAAYLVIYLYRWEWNRAIISGLFFVAAEVALASGMLLRRLQALEARLEPTSERVPAALERIRATPVDRPRPFAWLDARSGRLDVFVPVLLGAGVILSAFAYVVERVAEVTALPSLDRRLARRLQVITPRTAGPTGHELAGLAAPAAAGSRGRLSGGSFGPAVLAALAVGAIVVLGWLGIAALMDATQTRADPADRPARTTVELSVVQRHTTEAAVAAAEALWVGCRSTLGSQPTEARFVAHGGDRVALVLEPGIGRLTARRLTGCLTDLRVNLVIAHILAVESTPPRG